MEEYEKGKIVTGCVTGVEKYGIFLGLNDYYSGLIHISEISNNYVRNVSDYVNIGETIRAKIIDVDNDSCHVKLSIKDVDYRLNNKKRNSIHETKKGFSALEEHLDKWISDKMEELE